MIQTVAAHADTLTWGGRVIPKNPAEFWTLALVVVTIGLGVIALRGLASLNLTQQDVETAKNDLKLTKLDMETRAQRDSIELGIEQCQRMANDLFPLYAKVLKALAAAKVPVFVKDGSEVSFEENEEKAKIERARKWVDSLDENLKELTIELMNSLEGWAMYFTHRLADENVAFEPCSGGLSVMVITLYPGLLFQRRVNPTSGPFPNLVKLFKAWHGKKEMDRALKDAARWQERGFTLLPPLGTSVDIKE